jgi:capsular exopolysaccharide synthesis family protein
MSTNDKTLVTLREPDAPASEAYRALRTNLAFVGLDRPLRTVLLTSPGAEEGKSTVLANLAVTMAQTERKVLVVDCDLRRPALHEVFGLGNDAGLTTLLLDPAKRTQPPFQSTEVPGLQVLTSGPLPPRPADMVGSRRMEDLITWLAEQADIVLFDAPPVNAVTDATILATRMDGVLLVVRQRRTRRDAVQEARDRLMRVNARLIGAVLNGVDAGISFSSYYGQRPAKRS